MIKTIKKGICLSYYDGNGRKNRDKYLLGVTALLAFCALVLIFRETTGFLGKTELLTSLITGVYLCVMFVIMQGEKSRNWFWSGALILLLLLVVLFGKQMIEGARLFWNTFAQKWLLGRGSVLREVSYEMAETEHTPCRIIFTAGISAVICLLCCGIIAKCGWCASVLIVLSLFVNPVIVKGETSVLCVVASLFAAMFILLCSGWKKRRTPRPGVTSGVVCLILSAAMLMVCITPEAAVWGENAKERTRSFLHEQKYETGYGTLPEGKLADFTPYSGSAVPALVVSMDTPEVTYLRGFTGCTYEDGVWKPVENEVLAENSDLLYWLNKEEFNTAAQFEAAAFGQNAVKSNIIVQNLGACSAYLYLPYNTVSGSVTEYLVPENLNTDIVSACGNRMYMFSALAGGTAFAGQVLDNLRSSDDESVLQYRQAESAYRSYVYNTYLSVSSDMMQILEELYDETGIDYENANSLSREEAQKKALDFLNICFSEEGAELELPLKNLSGTGFQYATVATLVFRTFGIAARYAEGYVISEAMATEAGSGENINVDSSCARGWVEIYQDGIGWMPLELAPGLGEMTREENIGKNTDTSSVKVTEGKELEEEPKENEPEPEPLGGTLVTLKKALKWTAIIVLAAAIVLIALLMLRRKIVREKRAKLYNSENINEAVGWLFYDSAKLLEKMGFSNDGGSMNMLSEGIHESFGSEYGERYEDMVMLNGRALFSQKPMEEAQRSTALAFFDDTAAYLKTKVKGYKRLWIKWIRCMY